MRLQLLHTCTYLTHAVRVDHIYILLTMVLGKHQITTLKNNKSEIEGIEGVCDVERREKTPR